MWKERLVWYMTVTLKWGLTGLTEDISFRLWSFGPLLPKITFFITAPHSLGPFIIVSNLYKSRNTHSSDFGLKKLTLVSSNIPIMKIMHCNNTLFSEILLTEVKTTEY